MPVDLADVTLRSHKMIKRYFQAVQFGAHDFFVERF